MQLFCIIVKYAYFMHIFILCIFSAYIFGVISYSPPHTFPVHGGRLLFFHVFFHCFTANNILAKGSEALYMTQPLIFPTQFLIIYELYDQLFLFFLQLADPAPHRS